MSERETEVFHGDRIFIHTLPQNKGCYAIIPQMGFLTRTNFFVINLN